MGMAGQAEAEVAARKLKLQQGGSAKLLPGRDRTLPQPAQELPAEESPDEAARGKLEVHALSLEQALERAAARQLAFKTRASRSPGQEA